MKNKKGFTLVELLSVIVVLAIIIGLITISSTAISKRSKDKLYEEKKKLIIRAAEIYAEDHPTLASGSEQVCNRTIQDLINGGYLKKDDDKNVIDPRDESSMNDMHICFKKEGKNTIVTLKEDDHETGKLIKNKIIEAAKEYIKIHPEKKGTCITIQDLSEFLESGITGNYKICYDENGNVTVTLETDDNNEISCLITVKDKDNWKQEKTLTARIINAGKSNLQYSWDGSNYSNTLEQKNVTENGLYTLHIKVNNSSVVTCQATVKKIDKTKPTAKIIVNESNEYTNIKTIEAIEIQDTESGINTANIEYGWSISKTIEPTKYIPAVLNFTTGTISPVKVQVSDESKALNGNYYLWIKFLDLTDKANNSYTGGTLVSSGTFNFDNTAPSCNIRYKNNDQTTWKTSKVLIPSTSTDDYSGEIEYSWNDNTWSKTLSEKTINENDTYKLYVRDKVGNKRSCTIKEEYIDTNAPTLTVDVVDKDTVSKSKNVRIVIKDDKSGLDLSSSSIAVAIVKKGEEPGTLNYENLTGTLTNGEYILNKNFNDLTGEYYVYVDATRVSDIAKNKATTYKTDSFILDNTGPTCTINGASESHSQEVILEIEASDDYSYFADNPYSWDGVNYTDANTRKIFDNGTYTAYVKDELGNVGTCSTTLNSLIDRTAPTLEIDKQSDTTYSNTKMINLTIKDNESGLSSNQVMSYGLSISREIEPDEYQEISFENQNGVKQASKEIEIGEGYTGEYYLWLKGNIADVAGNELVNEALISNGLFYFDNDEPFIDINPTGDINPTKSKTFTITINDLESKIVSGASFQYGFSTSYEEEPTTYKTASVPAYSNGTEEIEFSITENSGLTGTYYLWLKATNLKDATGNTVEAPVVSDKLIFDNEAPICSITGIPTEYMENAILSIESVDNVSGLDDNAYSWDGINYSSTNTLEISENGDYTAYVRDKAGNIGACTATVEKLEKVYKCTGDNCPKCVRAKKLHTEVCDSESGTGCRTDSYILGQTIYYGNLSNTDNIEAGDAFDCDVNGDGKYEPSTERFYYVSDVWENTTYNHNKGTFIYSNNIYYGNVNNVSSLQYATYASSTMAPYEAQRGLPKIDKWTNTIPMSQNRAVYDNSYNEIAANVYNSNDASRLLSAYELKKKNNLDSWLLENTKYGYSNNVRGYWLETPSCIDDGEEYLEPQDSEEYESNEFLYICDSNNSTKKAFGVVGSTRSVSTSNIYSSTYGARPIIEILYSDVKTSSTAADYINDNAADDLIDDGTDDHVKRYTGANPNNYITFNGEDAGWRIIGIYGNKLKIIRTQSVGEKQFSQSTTNWDNSDLKKYLNETYYNELSSVARNMIDDGTWYIGSASHNSNAAASYTSAKQLTWTGKVGLMAAYEYQYAADSSNWQYAGSNYRDSFKDWLKSNFWQWTINVYSSNSNRALIVQNSGAVYSDTMTENNNARPVVYLKANTKILSGSGKQDDPYILDESGTRKLEVGDYINLTPTKQGRYDITSSMAGASSSITPSELTLWRIIKINNDGTIDAVSEYTSSDMVSFNNQVGYANFVGTLQTIAKQYAIEGYTKSVRIMGYDGQTSNMTYSFSDFSQSYSDTSSPTSGTGEEYNDGFGGDTLYLKDYKLVSDVYKTNPDVYGETGLKAYDVAYKTSVSQYWLASRQYKYGSASGYSLRPSEYYGRLIGTDGNLGKGRDPFYSTNDGASQVSNAIRPIITLKAGAVGTTGYGTKNNPYTIKNEKYSSNDIEYTKNGQSTVQEALDDLYTKFN